MEDIMSLANPVNQNDHVLGPPDAPVTLVEYGDYQCPYCRSAHFVVEQVRAHLGDQLRFVFRHMPLTQLHSQAEMAAEAAEAAGLQGKFWEMHRAIYEHQNELSAQMLTALAERLGLDMERFTNDLLTQRMRPRVKDDFMSAVRSGAAGTPSWFLNGERYNGKYDEGPLTEALEMAARTHGPMHMRHSQQPKPRRV
jgi:protein-disulfide isomerase